MSHFTHSLRCLAVLLACSSAARAGDSDYSRARQSFRSHLVREQPSPQKGEPLETPAGASRVEYDKERHLVAFLGGNSPKGGRQPAVLFLHGGFAYSPEDWMMAEPYRTAGFITMMPILRGENGQAGHFTLFYDEVDDVLAAARALSSLPGVDPKRVFIAGHSVGGTLTLLAAMATDTFRAATSLSGSPDQFGFTQGRPFLVPFDPADQREFLIRSPQAFATSFQCPVRIFYGSEEKGFAASSQDTAQRAAAKGADVKALAIPGNHFSAVPEEIRQSIAFFQGFMGKAAPAPARKPATPSRAAP
ncbi:alpha/beta hydrolase family protein [Cystobacter fuscus]|uniref:alpha/beta hydrolase family protein n=1 Tax=Cystobacter fuscus TaxID=43 RepID=UPI002B30D695|nr:alpha/beta fold hydrolase [Cystobacter fuscus]